MNERYFAGLSIQYPLEKWSGYQHGIPVRDFLLITVQTAQCLSAIALRVQKIQRFQLTFYFVSDTEILVLVPLGLVYFLIFVCFLPVDVAETKRLSMFLVMYR